MKTYAPYTIFEETKMMPVEIHTPDNKWEYSGTWDDELWIEREEDWYALSSPQLKDKRVRVVRREQWIRA